MAGEKRVLCPVETDGLRKQIGSPHIGHQPHSNKSLLKPRGASRKYDVRRKSKVKTRPGGDAVDRGHYGLL